MTDADHNIEIEVNIRYLQEHSDPTMGRYAFAYTIDITNRGEAKVKFCGGPNRCMLKNARMTCG